MWPGGSTSDTLNIIRVVACLLILGYSCVTDWKVRRAPNRLWYILGGIGLALGLIEIYASGFDVLLIYSWAFGVVFVFALMYFLYYLFQHFGLAGLGGADAKALIAVAITFPYYPHLEVAGLWLPLTDVTRSIVFGLAVFGNALVLNLAVPIGILIYNLLTVPSGELYSSPFNSFMGYMARIEGLKGKHVRLMYRYYEEEGQIKRRRALGGVEIDDKAYDDLLKWKRDGRIGERVWVTPKIPFLIPITAGFIVAIVYGDILTQIIGMVLLR
jgi:preflagellin peptidase FlaK